MVGLCCSNKAKSASLPDVLYLEKPLCAVLQLKMVFSKVLQRFNL